MRQAGEVTYADAHKQRRNEGYVAILSKYLPNLIIFFSVVEFASYSDMKNAIDKLDDSELNGRRVRLVEDRRRGSRRSRSSSSRSHSRSRSPRRSRSSRYEVGFKNLFYSQYTSTDIDKTSALDKHF